MSLLIVGSVALDTVKAPAGEVIDALGGSASYCSVAASFLADSVQTVAVVGEDFPREHLRLLEARGIDTSGIESAAGRTFRWSGVYGKNPNDRETLVTELNVFEDFRPRLSEVHRNAEFLFLGNIDPDLQREVLHQAEKAELVALDTMNFWIEGAPSSLERVLKKVDAVLINDGEASQLGGADNLVTAAGEIRRMGPSTVLIKKGEHGALLFHEMGVFAIPALPLETVKDPTGAGDSFAGGFMGYIAGTGDVSFPGLRKASVYGSVMASFCVEDFSLDGFKELDGSRIEARLNEFRKLTSFDN